MGCPATALKPTGGFGVWDLDFRALHQCRSKVIGDPHIIYARFLNSGIFGLLGFWATMKP